MFSLSPSFAGASKSHLPTYNVGQLAEAQSLSPITEISAKHWVAALVIPVSVYISRYYNPNTNRS